MKLRAAGRLASWCLVLVLAVLQGACEREAVRDQPTEAAYLRQPADEVGMESEGQQSQASDRGQSELAGGPVEQPDWNLGDQWLWSDGYGLRVSSIEGGTAILDRLDAENQWQRREGLFVVESRDSSTHRRVVFRSNDPSDLFPLGLGKQVVFKREYLADGALRVHRTSWVVEGREEIEVPAGRFDCWVLTRRSRSLQTDWTSYERMWFSPEAKNYVRLEYRYGRNPASSRVLMTYRLGSNSK